MNVRHLRISVAVILVAMGVSYLVYAATETEGIAYKDATTIRLEAQSRPPISPSSRAKLTGKVRRGNVERHESGMGARFDIVDATGGVMTIRYGGAIPDNFRDGSEVVVTGTYDRSRDIFEARELLTKCPSKYEASYDSQGPGLPGSPISREN